MIHPLVCITTGILPPMRQHTRGPRGGSRLLLHRWVCLELLKGFDDFSKVKRCVKVEYATSTSFPTRKRVADTIVNSPVFGKSANQVEDSFCLRKVCR